ncbi:MAG: hypothetical protein V1790_18020 [Planctomycetota bacterium]
MPLSHEAARLLQIVKSGSVVTEPAELRTLEDMIAGLQPPASGNLDAAPSQRQDS